MAAVLVTGLAAGVALALTIQKAHRMPPADVSPTHVVLDSAPMAPKDVAPVKSPPAVSVEPASGPAVAEPTLSSSRRAPRDRLAEEVAILSRAATNLEAGRASDALRAIDEHQRKFPNGLLAEERYAARVQALCALGRRDEAATELARLSRLAPDSPHVARARKSCASPAASAAKP
jgi:hypothetical protein